VIRAEVESSRVPTVEGGRAKLNLGKEWLDLKSKLEVVRWEGVIKNTQKTYFHPTASLSLL
jgi:hypothetical protein